MAGAVTDRLKNKRILIIIGYAVTGLGFLLFISIHNVWYLAVVQLAIGLARALAEPAYDALYSIHLDKHKEAEGWGAWEAMAYATAGVGALIGGAIVSVTSFATLFLIMAALCLFSAAFMFRIPERTF